MPGARSKASSSAWWHPNVTPVAYRHGMAIARFLHAADLHLGAPLQSLGRHLDDDLAERVRHLVRSAWDRLIETAIDRKVDFVVLAGDIYDTAERDPGARRRVTLGLRRLVDAGIGVFIVHGNHDPLSSDALGVAPVTADSVPVVIFGPGEVGQVRHTMSNGAEVTIAGISYADSAEPENLARRFASVTGRTVIGVLHTNVGSNSQHGDYAPCSVADLEEMPVHYWALGHIHDRQVHQTPRGYWAYPGNLQGRSTKATECGSKGVLIIGVEADGSLHEPEFVACDAVRFARLTVSLDAAEELDDAFDRVRTALEQLGTDADGRMVLVRLELTGATTLSAELERNGEEIIESLQAEATTALGDGAVIKVVNNVRPAVDLAAERLRPTLLGEVLNELDRYPSDVIDSELRSRVEVLLVQALDAER